MGPGALGAALEGGDFYRQTYRYVDSEEVGRPYLAAGLLWPSLPGGILWLCFAGGFLWPGLVAALCLSFQKSVESLYFWGDGSNADTQRDTKGPMST